MASTSNNCALCRALNGVYNTFKDTVESNYSFTFYPFFLVTPILTSQHRKKKNIGKFQAVLWYIYIYIYIYAHIFIFLHIGIIYILYFIGITYIVFYSNIFIYWRQISAEDTAFLVIDKHALKFTMFKLTQYFKLVLSFFPGEILEIFNL